jgi:putative ABC transport system permease protein
MIVQLVGRVARRLRMLRRRSEHERAMDGEMRFHLEMEAAELQRGGLSAEEAKRRARVLFGGVELFKEEGRDARGTRWLEDLWQDLGYALRQLRASPGFAAATVLTLALGVGVTTMMHSSRWYRTFEGSTLGSPDRLVYIGQGPRGCARCARMSVANYLTTRQRVRSLESMSLIAEWEPILRGGEQTRLTDGQRVTPEFFRTLDIQPLLGRTLVPEDSLSGRQHVIVLTEAMWRTHFQSDRRALGQSIILDRLPYIIVGVVANDAVYPSDTEFWAPLVWTPEEANDHENTEYRALGRLRAGATPAQLSAEVRGIGAQIDAELPSALNGSILRAGSLLELHRPVTDGTTLIFTAAVALVLLIACINLACLLIARLVARRRELAVRRAMGAAPGRIARQLLAETMLLTALGGVGGMVVAVWASRALFGSAALFFDGNAYALSLGIGLLCGLVIGLWPALRFARPQDVHELRDTTRTTTGSMDSARGRRVLVVVEVGFAVILLSAAGLLARSFGKTYEIAPGFSTEQVLGVRLQTPPPANNSVADPEHIDGLVSALEAVPGVEAVGGILGLPFGVGARNGRFAIEGNAAVARDEQPTARLQAATPGYFEALRLPVLRGRTFTPADRANAPRVAVINRTLAQRFFGTEDPIGRVILLDDHRWEVVGVIGDVFYGSTEELTAPEIYRPMQQSPRPTFWIALRTRSDPAAMKTTVAAAVRQYDPDLAITRLLTMDELRGDSLGSERHMLQLMLSFALAAILISAIGLYGVISYAVSQRTREFGVRLALGAQRQQVLRMVLGQGVRLAGYGAAVGVVVAIGLLQAMRSLLYGVSPTDPLTLALVVAVIAIVTLLAAFLPAQRAMLVDPMISLRDD